MYIIHPKSNFISRIWNRYFKVTIVNEKTKHCHKVRSCPYNNSRICQMWGDGSCSIHPEYFK